MGKWEMVRLGDVCEITNGFAFDSKCFNTSANGMPVIRIRDVVRGYTETYTAEDFRTDYIIKKGDLLIGMDGEFNISPWNSEDALLNQRVCKIKSISNKLTNSYLLYFLPKALKDIEDVTAFVTVKHLSSKQINNIVIPLPPLPVQQQIADALDRASTLIEKRKAQIDKLDLLVKSQFIEMFGDPVTNPKGWEVRTLSDIATSRLGKMLDAKQQTGKSEFPYLANYNVQWFRFELSELNKMDFSEADIKEFELKKGDLLVCEGGEVGRCAIWDNEKEPCYFQKALHRVRCNKEIILPEYLARWLYNRAQYNRFEDIIGQATIAHLPGVKLKQLRIPVPPLSLQTQFANFIHQVEAQKSLLQQSLAKLEHNYKSLMQKCFRGEIF